MRNIRNRHCQIYRFVYIRRVNSVLVIKPLAFKSLFHDIAPVTIFVYPIPLYVSLTSGIRAVFWYCKSMNNRRTVSNLLSRNTIKRKDITWQNKKRSINVCTLCICSYIDSIKCLVSVQQRVVVQYGNRISGQVRVIRIYMGIRPHQDAKNSIFTMLYCN